MSGVKKIKKLKVKDLCVEDIRGKVADFKIADVESLESKNAEIFNCDVTNLYLNGLNVNCLITSPSSINNISLFDPNIPPCDPCESQCVWNPVKPDNVDELVFECLVNAAKLELVVNPEQGDTIASRINSGRTKFNNFVKNCPIYPCIPMKLNSLQIYASKSLPIYTINKCEFTPPDFETEHDYSQNINATVSYVSSLFYDLDIVYDVDVVGSVEPLVVSVVCRIGYIDPENPETVIIYQLDIGNYQFTPTLDDTYGVKCSGTVSVPSELIQEAALKMPDSKKTGCVQLVIYKETGLSIWNSEGCRNFPVRCFKGDPKCQNPPTGATFVNGVWRCANGNPAPFDSGNFTFNCPL